MKSFHCSHCQNLVFFENTQCVHCGHRLAYSPSREAMVAIDTGPASGAVTDQAQAKDATHASGAGSTARPALRLCRNYVEQAVCNWAIDAGDDHELCVSCRLTHVIPPLDDPQMVVLWHRAETAKRRLVVSLLALGLPVLERTAGARDGIRFEFKQPQPGESVLTGHHEGTITLNLLEADDVLRERLRAHFEEPYRTVLGHLRHESGHYYWDRLVRDSMRLGGFRRLFGDESLDYKNALIHHYQHGPRDDWSEGYISAYASVHPWEDWAETWAHYLHMVDSLETARACGLSLGPRRTDEPALRPNTSGEDLMRSSFDALIDSWFPVTYLLNNLSRGLGLPDPYPFLLNATVIDKLRFVHDTIVTARGGLGPGTARKAA
jgi:hypothetical protein